MRKAQKQQAEELLRQVEQAHEQIRKYIEQQQIQLAMELLEDCQNAGISIGTLVEKTEGNAHPMIAILEDYCEVVYQIHETLAENSKNDNSAKKVYKQLKQKWIKVSNSLKNDVKLRIEAVFLPYKASMWDSLESVWQAADADPDCDAYVIPIFGKCMMKQNSIRKKFQLRSMTNMILVNIVRILYLYIIHMII